MSRNHGPILKTVSAALLVLAAGITLQAPQILGDGFSWSLLAWFGFGLLYTHLLEYGLHRGPMHLRVPFLENVRRNHLEHHRILYGPNFRTRRRDLLAHIPGRFWVFPLLFLVHYAVLTAWLPAGSAAAFLSGSVVHYVAFEMTHWFTHIEDNAFDRALSRVPLLRRAREYQIEHHRIHHEFPIVAFNFNPPYLGDRILGTMPGAEVPAPARAEIPPAPPGAPRPLVAAPTVARRFLTRRRVGVGAAVALGVAAVGLAVWASGHFRSAAAAKS